MPESVAADPVGLQADAESSAPLRFPKVRAFFAAPSGIAGLAVVSVILFFTFFGPTLFGEEADKPNYENLRASPSWDHLLGTDELGHDIFARLLTATQLSIKIGFAAAGIAFFIGVLLGSSVVVLRRWARPVVLRFIDTMISFPGILKAVVVATIIGVGARSVILGVGIALSFGFARITSTLALGIGAREYINAARVVGVRGPKLLFRYIIPNIAEPLVIFAGIAIGAAIITAAGLSFLGLGVGAPQYDWGRMLTDGVDRIFANPAGALGPAVAIAITALAFALTGEAVARSLNPLLWTTPRKSRRMATPHLAPTEEDLASVAVIHDFDVVTETPVPAAAIVAAAAENGNGAAAGDPAGNAVVSVIEARDLTVTFPSRNGPTQVVRGVSFTVGPGERIGIVGESGSGKTMTALALAQLTPWPGKAGGAVVFQGHDLGAMPPRARDALLGTGVAFVYQDPLTALNPALNIGTQLTEGIRHHRGLSSKEARNLALDALAEVQIPGGKKMLRRYPHELSGGMRQRVVIAMGLLFEPSLLLCDEPTTALDVTIQAQIMDLLLQVNQTHDTAIVLISHNLALIGQNCDRILVMYAGEIVEELTADQLLTSPQHPYTRALLASVPEFGVERNRTIESIPGEPPDPARLPTGCAFHPRCPLAVERCRLEKPVLAPPADGGSLRAACHLVT